MKIRLAGWDSTGLRSPDVKLSLAEHGKVPRLVLLQMPNGTGKTTTLNLIQAAMTGSAANWTAEQIGDPRVHVQHRIDAAEAVLARLLLILDKRGNQRRLILVVAG